MRDNTGLKEILAKSPAAMREAVVPLADWRLSVDVPWPAN
jgi:hypothetical protein